MRTMTFYAQQVQQANQALYSKDYLIKKVICAKQYMDQHFEEDIHLNDLASKAFISKFHFTRLFKSLYGRTPHQYLISVRIGKAKKLLITGKSISGTCVAVGFHSDTSFTGLFKKITGHTPSAFKHKSNFREF